MNITRTHHNVNVIRTLPISLLKQNTKMFRLLRSEQRVGAIIQVRNLRNARAQIQQRITYKYVPKPVAVRSKAYICCRQIAWIVGSKPAEGMDVRLLCLLCFVLVAASVTASSLVQSPTGCVSNGCGLENSAMTRPRPDLR